MTNHENILDDFQENKAPVVARQYYYWVQLGICFGIVWGLAALHWMEVIFIMPLPEKPLFWGALCMVTASTMFTNKQVLKFGLGFTIFITFLMLFCNMAIGMVLINTLYLESQKLPLFKELIRLSIITISVGISPVLLTELYYKNLQNKN